MTDRFDGPRATISTEATRRERREVVLGFVLVPVLHVVGLVALFGLCALATLFVHDDVMVLPLVAGAVIGVSQIAWVGPVLLLARRQGRTGLVQGALIAATITFFLNAACWGLISLGGLRLAG